MPKKSQMNEYSDLNKYHDFAIIVFGGWILCQKGKKKKEIFGGWMRVTDSLWDFPGFETCPHHKPLNSFTNRQHQFYMVDSSTSNYNVEPMATKHRVFTARSIF